MRQEMSKTNEKGPKKVDQGQYKEIMKEQAQQHANLLASVTHEDNNSPPVKKEAWRKGDIEASPGAASSIYRGTGAHTALLFRLSSAVARHAGRLPEPRGDSAQPYPGSYVVGATIGSTIGRLTGPQPLTPLQQLVAIFVLVMAVYVGWRTTGPV
jgi:hypothetical protein